jgi:hypothetical protein
MAARTSSYLHEARENGGSNTVNVSFLYPLAPLYELDLSRMQNTSNFKDEGSVESIH